MCAPMPATPKRFGLPPGRAPDRPGGHGWSLDRGGITDMSPDAVADYLKGLKRDINNLFRFQRKEPGLDYEYGGVPRWGLKENGWV